MTKPCIHGVRGRSCGDCDYEECYEDLTAETLLANKAEAEVKRLTTEGARMRRHLENTIQTMKEMGTLSGQTISTSWVLRMAESALPATASSSRSSSDG